MAIMRVDPYVWVTWLTHLLVGDHSCEWSAWFRTRYKNYEKVHSTFDFALWSMQHKSLLDVMVGRLEAQEYSISLEGQNSFTLRGASGIVLGGKPDVIATREQREIILDAKTGQPSQADIAQVMIYMWAVPRAISKYSGMVLDGRVVYSDHEIDVPSCTIDNTFQNNLVELIRKVGGPVPLRKVPTAAECRFCPIAISECPERIEEHYTTKTQASEF